VASNKRWAFFSTRNIYNDLMKVQQRLINNNRSEKRQFMSYFIWAKEQDTS
jgi:hypothetical protein